MPISIPSDITSKEQLLQAQHYITQNLVEWSFEKDSHTFLPLPHIKELATSANIKAFSDQDLSFLRHNIPENFRDFFINRVFTSSERCFVATLRAGQNMRFLSRLMNYCTDNRLPIRDGHHIDVEFHLSKPRHWYARLCSGSVSMTSRSHLSGCFLSFLSQLAMTTLIIMWSLNADILQHRTRLQ